MVVRWIGWLYSGLDGCMVDWMIVRWIGRLLGRLYGCRVARFFLKLSLVLFTQVKEKSGRNIFFKVQGKSGNLNYFLGKSGNFVFLDKVRETSGNFYVLSNVKCSLKAMAIFWK